MAFPLSKFHEPNNGLDGKYDIMRMSVIPTLEIIPLETIKWRSLSKIHVLKDSLIYLRGLTVAKILRKGKLPHLLMSKRKRTRASSRHDPDEEDAAMNEASEDESEEELPPRKSRKTSSKPASEPAPLPRQSILGSDDSEDEDQEQDLDSSDDEEMATQSRSASERRGGTVEEIILENFMCHKHLKTTLGPKINFLTGPNGSKSCVSHPR